MIKDNIKIRLATSNDAESIKILINEMYRTSYETRNINEIKKQIDTENEIYSIIEIEGKIAGFCGVFISQTDEVKASIEYIYLTEKRRNLLAAYKCLMFTVKKLINKKITCAKLQVQTYNKQRFLHYAITDKNIIFEQELETSKGEKYFDQILLIKDLSYLLNLPFSTLIKKVQYYKNTEK